MGYVTSGATLRIVSIDRILEVTTVLELDSIIEKKAEALKAFYNLTFVLSEMAKLHKVTDRVRLLPFKPEMDGSMLLLPMDVYTQCIIGRRDCEGEEDFARLASVFGSLQKLSNLGSANTHLETVRRLEVSSDQLVVQLSLLRFERIPVDADEIRQWVGYMLTALRHWHSCNYCHGDVCWENVVYVPVANVGYWVLTGLDLFHLEIMMKKFERLPEELLKVRAALLTAFDTPKLTVNTVMSMMQPVRHALSSAE
ncbi:Tyrosine-protein kinase, active site [Phytophthora cinnamomi]|uniref:Tyrosine-protein kinase, active site n=1 Tax=Phytophthora cinnamomi TaxID=4785 RepID=UPI0035599EEC|nr:Tyrosine-protein kinase, active site [Phytophthora cinnamomi]